MASNSNNLQLKTSEDSTFSGVYWQTYSPTINFTLSAGDGVKKVYAVVKDVFDITTAAVKDGIIMDTTPPLISLTVTPDSGITGDTNFVFDLMNSSDNLCSAQDLQICFDWNNDGIYDTDWKENQITNYVSLIGGRDKTATVCPPMIDQDGNVYKIIRIGDQWWMAENLRVTHYRNGDPIPNITNNLKWESQYTTGAYCNLDNNINNIDIYGLLYNSHVVFDDRNIAPEGWHVPTNEEFTTKVLTINLIL